MRPAARQFLTLPLFATAVFVTAVALPLRGVPWLLFPLAAVLTIPQIYGVKLTDTHLVYLRLLGPQRLPWESIRKIETRSTLISAAVSVLSPVSADRLAAPRQGWLLKDPQFDDKLELLRRWWITHRGESWRPPQ